MERSEVGLLGADVLEADGEALEDVVELGFEVRGEGVGGDEVFAGLAGDGVLGGVGGEGDGGHGAVDSWFGA